MLASNLRLNENKQTNQFWIWHYAWKIRFAALEYASPDTGRYFSEYGLS